MRAVNDAMEESSSAIGALFKFASGLIAPEDDEGTVAVALRVVGGSTQDKVTPAHLFPLLPCRNSVRREEKRFVPRQLGDLISPLRDDRTAALEDDAS